MANRWGKKWKQWQILFSWAPKSLQMVTAATKLKDTCSLKKSYDQARQRIKKQRRYFANKGPYSQSYDFSSSHIWILDLDHKVGWAPKNWCFLTAVLEKTLERALDSMEIKPVNPKLFTGRTDTEAEAPHTLATWCEELIHWKRPWCWERLRKEREGGNRGWDVWMASLN